MSARLSKYFYILLTIFALAFLPSLAGAQTLVNINTAGSEELKTLTGIGPAYAQNIIDYRNVNGTFQTIEEIKNVSGIGDVTFANIKNFITVGESSNQENTESNENGSNVSSSSSVRETKLPLSSLKAEIKSLSTTAVGTPLVLKVETNFGDADKFVPQWSFGDGSVSYGARVEHTYFYPGEYVVVLRISMPYGVVTDRVNIKVITPELLISSASPERIEVTNSTKSEVNLFGRVLMSGGESFVFPQDTIILPGQKINFASTVTGLAPRNVEEVYIMTVGEDPNRSYNGMVMMEEARLAEIAKIENKLLDLQSQLASAQKENLAFVTTGVELDTSTEIQTDDVGGSDFMAASVLSVDESDEIGFWQKLKNFFLRTE